MFENRILILADDLTGANDTAIRFVERGLPALVITDPVPRAGTLCEAVKFPRAYDVISINCDSRRMSGDDAYRVVHKIAGQFGAGFFVYKKIDSVLRGNPGRELAAVMDALDVPLALVAPSFPANRSVLERGMSGDIDAVRVFSCGRKTKNIPLEIIRQGPQAAADFIVAHNNGGVQVFIVDALTDADLRIIRESSAVLNRPHILSGSAGLAGQLAEYLGKERAGAADAFEKQAFEKSTFEIPAASEKPLSPVLVIAGTRQKETAAQIEMLSRKFMVPVIKFDVSKVIADKSTEAVNAVFAEASRLMRQNACLCIVALTSLASEESANSAIAAYNETDETAAAICEALGLLCKRLADTFQFPVILSTGGDTSLSICRKLAINAIKPLREICPGIPLGRISGGPCEGRFIITKSGRFGNPDSLLEIMDFLGAAP
jgi:uncharacterized protein YgbK (DUF1537 family)